MDPLNDTCWKHKWSFHDRGGTWSTPMAGSEKDWRLKDGSGPPRKAEVIPTLEVAIHLSTLQVKRQMEAPLRKEREIWLP